MGYVMRVSITGTRDGEDWPPIGAPIPKGLPKDEVEHLLRAGLIGEERATAPKGERAEVDPEEPTPLEPENRRARR